MLRYIPYERELPPFPPPKPLGVADALGRIRLKLELVNGYDLAQEVRKLLPEDQVRKLTINALVDTGCMMLAINETIRDQLGLIKIDERSMELADGTIQPFEVVGPVEIRIPHRRCSVDALVLPGDAEPLLGVIPIEDMDLIIDPKRGTIQIDPTQPYVSRKLLK